MANPPQGQIATEVLDSVIETADISDSAVTAAKLASNSVTNVKMADDSVDTAEVLTDAITSAEIAASAVDSSEINTDAVTAAKIATDAVGTDALDTTVSYDFSANQTFSADVLDGAANVIYDQSVNSILQARLENDSLTVSSGNALAGGGSVALGGSTTLDVATGGVDTAELADTAVTNAKIDGSEGTSGQFLQTDGSATTWASVGGGGKFEQALSNGEVLADDGNLYTSINTALTNATTYIFIGPGTFTENVTIPGDNYHIQGSGDDTLIDGGDDIAIDTDTFSNGSTIKDLAVTVSTSDTGVDSTANDILIENVTVQQANTAIEISDQRNIVRNCRAINCTNGIQCTTGGILIGNTVNATDNGATTGDEGAIIGNRVEGGAVISGGSRTPVVGNYVFNGAGANFDDDAISLFDDESLVKGNVVESSQTNGIAGSGNDIICSGNIVKGASSDGIAVSGTDVIVSDNRVGGSGGSDINSSSATNPLVTDNLTGAFN